MPGRTRKESSARRKSTPRQSTASDEPSTLVDAPSTLPKLHREKSRGKPQREERPAPCNRPPSPWMPFLGPRTRGAIVPRRPPRESTMAALGDELVRHCWQLLHDGQPYRALVLAERALRLYQPPADSVL